MTETDDVEPSDPLNEACRRYAELRPVFAEAAKSVAGEVEAMARTLGCLVKVSHRAKEVDSFVKKAVHRGYDDAWASTTDKAGARAVVFDPGSLYPLVEALEDAWSDRCAGPREDKRLELGEKTFDYSGVHLHVVVPGVDTDGEPVECEVQLRTAAQDAWAVLDHEYVYKGLVDIPAEAKRGMVRAVALMETFDEEVKRVVEMATRHPSYPHAMLIRDAERAFYSVATSRYDAALTAHVTSSLLDAIPEAERPAYGKQLSEFTATHHDRIVALMEGFRDVATQPRYALMSQPEAMVLFERVENAEMALEAAIADAGSDLRRLVQPVLAAWGKPLTDA